MKLILVGTDRKIFENGSRIQNRFVEYGNLFDELYLIVFNKGEKVSDFKIGNNVFVYPTNSNNKFSCVWNGFKIAQNIIKNWKLTKSNSRDFIISSQDPFETGIVGFLIKFFNEVSFQVQLHTDFNNKYFLLSSPLNFLRFFLAYLVLPYADAVRVVSERVKNNIKDLNQDVSVLPIYMDFDIGQNISKKPFSILTVSRLEEEKNLESALRAFALVSPNFPEAVFIIAGEGRDLEKLKNLAKELKIEERVNFLGWVDDLPKLYGESQVYISTSLFEGYGMSIVEAAKAGCVLVISDTGVAGEIFKDGESAFVFKPKDVAQIADFLKKIFENPDLSNKFSIKAKEAASNLNNRNYFSEYKKVMEKTLGKNMNNPVLDIFRANKVLRFIVGGITAASTQILFLYIFTDLIGIWYLLSSIFSFCIAFVLSFLLQKIWVFRNRKVKGSHIQFMKYVMVGLLGISLNTFVMYLFVTVMGFWYILAQLISGVIVAVFNFFVYRKFIFTTI